MMVYNDTRQRCQISERNEGVAREAPIYLGIHLSNLCRDGLLSSAYIKHRNQSSSAEQLSEGGAGEKERARKEVSYYALDGAFDRVPLDNIWPQAKRAQFVMDRWDHFSPFLALHDRSTRSFCSSTSNLYSFLLCSAVCVLVFLTLPPSLPCSPPLVSAFIHPPNSSPTTDAQCREIDGATGTKLLRMTEMLAGVREDEDSLLYHALENLRKHKLPVKGQPSQVVGGEMRGYQVEGLRWMAEQHDLGAGIILGDEMVSSPTTLPPPSPPPSHPSLSPLLLPLTPPPPSSCLLLAPPLPSSPIFRLLLSSIRC
eukprot:758974-Hanusia_phi.AAC.2